MQRKLSRVPGPLPQSIVHVIPHVDVDCIPSTFLVLLRIQSVCSRMAELQSLCKQASIGLPLSHVLAGKGLYEQLDQVGNGSSGRINGSCSEVIHSSAQPQTPTTTDEYSVTMVPNTAEVHVRTTRILTT